MESVFFEHLERLGLFQEGKPRSYLEEVRHDAGTILGYWHDISGFGADGLACGKGPYWSIAEIIVPEDKLLITARSTSVDDPEESTSRFYTKSVTYEQGGKLHWHSLRGGTRKWESYQCQRTDDEIEAGVAYAPFIWFEVCDADHDMLGIRIDEESLLSYLVDSARRQDQLVEENRVNRRIIRFCYSAHPGSFRQPLKNIFESCPQLRGAVRDLLPTEYEWKEIAQTITNLAEDLTASGLRTSPSTIRQFFRELRIKPLSKSQPFVFAAEYCDLFAEYRKARQEGIRTKDALQQARTRLAPIAQQLEGPDTIVINTRRSHLVQPDRFHRPSLFETY